MLDAMRTVLVVEDDPLNLRLMTECLGFAGYHSLCAHDCRSAMETVKDHDEIDLVLVDILLPDDDGVTLGNHIAAAKPELPVLFISASNRPRRVPVERFLGKPFRVGEFLDFVRSGSRLGVAIARNLPEPLLGAAGSAIAPVGAMGLADGDVEGDRDALVHA